MNDFQKQAIADMASELDLGKGANTLIALSHDADCELARMSSKAIDQLVDLVELLRRIEMFEPSAD